MRSRLGATAAVGLALALTAGSLWAPLSASADDPVVDVPGLPVTPTTPVTLDDPLAVAREALDIATGLLDGTAAAGSGDLTMALRDVALTRSSLRGAERAEADALLEDRPLPSSSPKTCNEIICVHYVTSGVNAIDATDDSGNGVPDYADFTLTTVTDVHNIYVAAGYRAPKSDNGRGGDDRVDIYLGDLGPGYYGFCTTDQQVPANRSDVWAYCALDNDYEGFPLSAEDNIRVTAAHEYFHAVQFGYDIREDTWFMEATATWAEDELYTSINDNRQYLNARAPYDSPLRSPQKSMDRFEGLYHYGAWIFFRYLTERYGAEQGGMPTLVRNMWRRADDAPGGRDEYSLQAIKKVLQSQNASLTTMFARFSQANRQPGRSYDEGASLNYPASPLAGTVRLAPTKTSATKTIDLDHLSSATYRFQPTQKLTGEWKLRLNLDLTSPGRGGAAIVTIQKKGAKPEIRVVKLNAQGNATTATRIGRGAVSWVEVTLANAGDSFTCNRNTIYSCSGVSKDDDLRQKITARAVRG